VQISEPRTARFLSSETFIGSASLTSIVRKKMLPISLSKAVPGHFPNIL
jgi:hypothetical protein